MSKNSKLVYSTDKGRIKDTPEQPIAPETDGKIRVKRETKGRKGAGVSIVEGLTLEAKPLKALAKQLKQHCGTGGTIKEYTIEIQGDHREKIVAFLCKKGYNAIKAGG